jgi:hypothetical protein
VINENAFLIVLLSTYILRLLPMHVSRWYDRVEMQELASPQVLEYIVAD